MTNILSRDKLLKITLFFAIFILCINKISDFDIFYHIKTGEYIIKNGFLNQDIFSYTAKNQEWITHEWLSQVIFYLIYKLFGFLGIIFFKSFLILLTFYIIYKQSLKYSHFTSLSVVLIFLSAYISSMFFTERPHLFSFLFVAILFFILENKKLFFLPAIFLLWCNLHSGFILGLMILCIYAFFERKLFLYLAISIFACIINPSGIKILTYPFSIVFNPYHIELITEWQSPNFHLWQMMLVELFIFAGIISFIIKKDNVIWKDVILFLFLVHLSLYSVRNIPFFATISSLVILKNLSFTTKPQNNIVCADRPFINFIFLIFLLLVVSFTVYQRLHNKNYLKENEFPQGAVNFITKNKLSENIFNEYDWGGYLIFHNIPVFVDGRQDLYAPSVIEEYLKVMNFEDEWEKILNKYKVRFLLLKRTSPLARILEKIGFKRIYSDNISIIFERKEEF